ncbi:hypothetical protein DXG01_014238 [Tephrocybe rancida]|nr:hypothetical protein DXG01_014238 [Tephrocybe rancida]
MATPKRCLVMIDLQNDFIAPEGRFRIHGDSLPFLENLHDISTAFHVSGYPVFWIRSEYATPNQDTSNSTERRIWDPTKFLAGTHTGPTPCCVKGSVGADFPLDVRALVDKSSSGQGGSIILTKTWYSAFKETSFLNDLKSRGITELFVGGIQTNVCVNATVNDALAFGFGVTLLEDCLGWRKRASHDRALRAMTKLGARLSSSEVICPTGPLSPTFDSTTWKKLPELLYVNGSIPSWRVMMALHDKGIKFRRTRLLVMSDPKETRLPEFLKLNHRGKTPVFVDVLPDPPADPVSKSPISSGSVDKTVTINESLAILHYIEAYHNPARPLLPPLANRAAHARALARIQESENLRLIYDELEDAHFGAEHAGIKLDAAERARLISAVDKELDYWETYAEKTAFIAGDGFGLADCAFFPILAYIVHRGFDWRRRADAGLEDAWPYLKEYYHRVWERGGKDGCAQRSQPGGWNRGGKANLWRGTRRNAKGLYDKQRQVKAPLWDISNPHLSLYRHLLSQFQSGV